MSEVWNSVWKWLDDNHNQISIIIAIFAMISWKASRDALCKIIKLIWEWFKKLWYKIKYLLNKIINKLREITVGKENLELLKELEILRGNKLAIKILKELKNENESKVNGGYEALITIMSQYSNKMDFSEFGKEYEKDKNAGFGSENFVSELRKKTLKKLIDDIVWRTDNNY